MSDGAVNARGEHRVSEGANNISAVLRNAIHYGCYPKYYRDLGHILAAQMF